MQIIICDHPISSELAKVEQAIIECANCQTYEELKKTLDVSLDIFGDTPSDIANRQLLGDLQIIAAHREGSTILSGKTKKNLERLIDSNFTLHVPDQQVIDSLCESYKQKIRSLKESLPQIYDDLAAVRQFANPRIAELITLSHTISLQTSLLLDSGLELSDAVRKIQEERHTEHQILQNLTPAKFFIQHIVNLPTAHTIADISFPCSAYFALADENVTSKNIDIFFQLWDRHLELQRELYALAQIEVHVKDATENWTMTNLDFCLFYLCVFSGDLSSTTYGMASFSLQAMINLWARISTKIQFPTEAEFLTMFKLPLLAYSLMEQPLLTDAITVLNTKNTELKRKIDTLHIGASWHGVAKGLLDWLAPVPNSSSLLGTLGFFSLRRSVTKIFGTAGNFLLRASTKFFTAPDLVELEPPSPKK